MSLLKNISDKQCQKTNLGHVPPATIQISLRMRKVRSEYFLCAFWTAKNIKLLYANNEDSEQPVRCAGGDLCLR